jgi:Ca2+-binding EF-hand superfamily protein
MTKPMLLLAPLFFILAHPAHAAGGKDGGALLDRADTDHDGRVTRDEFRAARRAMFDRLDRDHDGVVTPGGFRRLRRFRPKAADRADQFIESIDLDRDGRATVAELERAPLTLFDLLDANHDGAIDADERRAAAARRAPSR